MKTEKELIEEMKHLMLDFNDREYKGGRKERATHVKAIGLVKAKFKVNENIPENLKIGLFEKAKTYDAIIRFAPSASYYESDAKKDYIGLAIKILDVAGKRLAFESETIDFLLQSHPCMYIGKLKDFRDMIYMLNKTNPFLMVMYFLVTGRFSIVKNFESGKSLPSSVLDISYWSQTPYKFGPYKVKYKISPTSQFKSEKPKKLTKTYLKDAMANHLQNDTASFDFSIQLFDDEKTTPIEDAAIEWKEQVTPAIKLAEITIEKQQLNSVERDEFQKEISFDLTNTLEAHEPIGPLNRARMEVYKNLANNRQSKTIGKHKKLSINDFR